MGHRRTACFSLVVLGHLVISGHPWLTRTCGAVRGCWSGPCWVPDALRTTRLRHGRSAPLSGRPKRAPLRALAGTADGGIFGFTQQAVDAVGTGLLSETSFALLPVLFLAGLLSSVNPCNVAALPAALASTAALRREGESIVPQAVAFAVGSSVVLALLGMTTSVLGEKLLLSQSQWRPLFPALAVFMGSNLLGIAPSTPLIGFSTPAVTPQGVLVGIPREVQGFVLGAASAAGSSPCATPVLMTVISYVATHPLAPGATLALFLSYALGYNLPLACAAVFAGALPFFQSGSRLGPLLAGTFILSLGTAGLLSLCEEQTLAATPAPPGALSALVACVAAAALASRVMTMAAAATTAATPSSAATEQASGDAAIKAEVVPVEGQQGVYRYLAPADGAQVQTPAPTEGRTDGGRGDDGDDGPRRAALLAVCLGASAAEATASMNSKPDSPAEVLRSMAMRSRPLSLALRSGRPVLVDFSATWCPDCLKLAPALDGLKEEYSDQVEFVTVDLSPAGPGAQGTSSPLDPDTMWWAREFRVDGIPHLAFVSASGKVQTALVGDVPIDIIRADVEGLRQGVEALPFVMYDAFSDGRSLSPPPATRTGIGLQ